MGYDVHVTRKGNWFEEDGPEISEVEWRALVDADPEMVLEGEASADLPGGKILTVTDPTLAVWHGWSGHGVGGNKAWLWLSTGNVVAKNPDAEILSKLHDLAERLGGQVQGDEGEVYDADGAVISDAPKAPWWKFWA